MNDVDQIEPTDQIDQADQIEQVVGVEPNFGPKQLVESVLFVATEPITVRDLARTLTLPADAIEAALDQLDQDYQSRGIRLLRHADQIQLVSAPEAAGAIERFLGVQHSASRLSHAALETLAIIAYKQPLTKSGIESIRGVDCSGPVRTLLQRGLIAEVGRLQTAGRPVLYGTTEDFLKQFGLGHVAQLPPIDLSKLEARENGTGQGDRGTAGDEETGRPGDGETT